MVLSKQYSKQYNYGYVSSSGTDNRHSADVALIEWRKATADPDHTGGAGCTQLMATILCIQADTNIGQIVDNALASEEWSESHTLLSRTTLDAAFREVHKDTPDLIILDGVLVYQNGGSVCRKLHGVKGLESTPILVLANANSAQDIAQVLDAGCDDCVRISVAERELAARIRALLRRKGRTPRGTLLTLNASHKTVYLRDTKIELTPTEYDLLAVLCEYPGQHLSTASLLETVWHYPPGTGDPALVRNHVRNLRRKLEVDPDHPRIVMSFQGRGYTVTAEVRQS